MVIYSYQEEKQGGINMLNEQQKELVQSIEQGGYVQCLASAGSGKSTTLVESIANLIDKGVNPYQILLITYTKDSSQDLVRKLKDKGDKYSQISTGTVHAICYKILSMMGYNLKNQLAYYEIENRLKKAVSDTELNVADVISFIGFCKANGYKVTDKMPIEFVDKLREKYIEMDITMYMFLWGEYEELKQSKLAYDFGDYLIMVRDIYKGGNRPYTFEYVLLDESQDSCPVTLELLDLLCSTENITMVGDVRQSLYGFLGGSPELAISKIEDGGYASKKIVNMHINYRSTKDVVDLSNYVIRDQMKEGWKEAESFNKEVGNAIRCKSFYDVEDEASYVLENIKKDIENGIPPEEIMVISRLNNMQDNLEVMLKREGIEYVINKSVSFFDRHEIQGFLCVLRLILNDHDDIAYSYMFKWRCGIFQFLPNALLNSIDFISKQNGTSYLEASTKVEVKMAYQATNLKNFQKMISRLRREYEKGKTLVDLVEEIARNMNYRKWCETKGKTDDEADNYWNSFGTLKKIIGINDLKSFLELAYAPPKKKETNKKGAVRLMSIHASKGLEAQSVYVIGLINQKFPSIRSDYAEEQRILYVALSRSKRKLTVTGIEESDFLYLVERGIEEIYRS